MEKKSESSSSRDTCSAICALDAIVLVEEDICPLTYNCVEVGLLLVVFILEFLL